jgi:hypothetical protein
MQQMKTKMKELEQMKKKRTGKMQNCFHLSWMVGEQMSCLGSKNSRTT